MRRGFLIGATLLAIAITLVHGGGLATLQAWAHAGPGRAAAHAAHVASARQMQAAATTAAERGNRSPMTGGVSLASYVPGRADAVSAPRDEEVPAEEIPGIDGLPSDDPYVRAFERQGDERGSSVDDPSAASLADEVPEGSSDAPTESSASTAAGRAEEAAAPATGPAAEPARLLVSAARETWVLAGPSWQARKLGYLRAGAAVARGPKPVGDKGCSGGWYSVAPHGYVCAGATATIDTAHPVAALAKRRPDMFGLPYDYALSRFPPPPLYVRLPTADEQRLVEPELSHHLRKHARLAAEPGFVPPPAAEPVPDALREGAVLPALSGPTRGAERITAGVARVRSGFALLGTFEREGRSFGLTTEMTLVPLDRTRVVRPSSFRGVALSDEFTLPVAFVKVKRGKQYVPQGETGSLRADGPIGWREAVALTGQSRTSGGALYYEGNGGRWVRADEVVRIDAARKLPGWARSGRRWVDVSILKQALVAYEGATPVYVTLVSTGADGIGDPETTHSTVQGTFLVHTKHVSVTMDGDEPGDEFDFNDVPFVQYFTEGYALHGAYWHDDFGTPRSHGCVNLAPIDAAWLFRWTTPEVPEGWHAALSAKRGTVVHVHP